MGRCFEEELKQLELIYDNANEADIKIIIDFLSKYRDETLLLVGSGGSFSVAVAFEFLCTKAGMMAKSMTPLALSQYKNQIKNSAIILFTAGGRNLDSQNSYKFISELEPEAVLTICMNTDAPIKKIQRNNLHNYFFEYKMKAKDGYLSVESLISTITISINAFSNISNDEFFKVERNVKWRNYLHCVENIKEVLSNETIIVLHGGITTPIAVDLESKFSETSLGNIQLADFRNFAHGRHFWISSRMNSTAIIAIVGTSECNLANKTLDLIPKEIPVLKIDIEDICANGLLQAYDFLFELVNIAGGEKGINPGKPKVEEFGRKLYHLNNNINKVDWKTKIQKDIVESAVYRKVGLSNKVVVEKYKKSCKMYLDNLKKKVFSGLILDYDGTLHVKGTKDEIEDQIFNKINYFLNEGLKIGIATGRGISVRHELQKVIDKKFWEDVIIAYYNGGCIGKLNDNNQPNKSELPIPIALMKARQALNKVIANDIYVDGIKDENPYQLTIVNATNIYNDLCAYITGELFSSIKDVKILKSNHSIDIVPVTSKKNNIINYYKEFGENDFLYLGDSGHVGGNDYELLNSENALSVDLVSNSMDYCWNFSPLGLRNLEATWFYFEKIKIRENSKFTIKGL